VSSRLRGIARDTLTLLDGGAFADQVARAVVGTRLYRPEDAVPPPTAAGAVARVEVTGERCSTRRTRSRS